MSVHMKNKDGNLALVDKSNVKAWEDDGYKVLSDTETKKAIAAAAEARKEREPRKAPKKDQK